MIGNHQPSDSEKIWNQMVAKEEEKSSNDGQIRCKIISNTLKSMLKSMNDFKNLCLCSFMFESKTFDHDKLEP